MHHFAGADLPDRGQIAANPARGRRDFVKLGISPFASVKLNRRKLELPIQNQPCPVHQAFDKLRVQFRVIGINLDTAFGIYKPDRAGHAQSVFGLRIGDPAGCQADRALMRLDIPLGHQNTIGPDIHPVGQKNGRFGCLGQHRSANKGQKKRRPDRH